MPVALVVGSLAGGMSFEEVQREYDLSIDDIRAALKFAGELIEQEQFRRACGYDRQWVERCQTKTPFSLIRCRLSFASILPS